ncbi:MAG: protein phosphatase 2C domain-containing protein [Eubacteriales bacterium]|nr:protein phosphatase 2C domain-containing protein [Eubacteriales bacterium]
MIKQRSFCYAGSCHNNLMEFCQDQTAVRTDGGKNTVVLCDGAGNSLYGGIAARICAETIAEHMQKNFEKYLFEESAAVKREVIQKLRRALSGYACAHHIDEKALASTILAVTMDNNGRFAGLHLGDGIILWKISGRKDLEIVSSPENGLDAGSTFLTMNCKMFYHLKFFRWRKPEAERILLITDGMFPILSQISNSSFDVGNEAGLQQLIRENHLFDDCSYGLLEL